MRAEKTRLRPSIGPWHQNLGRFGPFPLLPPLR